MLAKRAQVPHEKHMVPLSFAQHDFMAHTDAALYWPAQNALLVADLHLEKASWYAKGGQMLPPYDSRATLERLTMIIAETGSDTIYCLGDNFHDCGGEQRLEAHAAGLLQRLTARTDWYWINGNHDAALDGCWGGKVVPEIRVEGIMLRHEAEPGYGAPEMSGHFHPKLRLRQRSRSVARRCYVASDTKLIFPAFGALTGGLDADSLAIRTAMAARASALVPVPGRLLQFPLFLAEAIAS